MLEEIAHPRFQSDASVRPSHFTLRCLEFERYREFTREQEASPFHQSTRIAGRCRDDSYRREYSRWRREIGGERTVGVGACLGEHKACVIFSVCSVVGIILCAYIFMLRALR